MTTLRKRFAALTLTAAIAIPAALLTSGCSQEEQKKQDGEDNTQTTEPVKPVSSQDGLQPCVSCHSSEAVKGFVQNLPAEQLDANVSSSEHVRKMEILFPGVDAAAELKELRSYLHTLKP